MTDSAGFRAWLAVYLKGACMGAADTVPGVSGGTIAVIVGVYERLITALTSVDPSAARHLLSVHTPEGRTALAEDLVRMDVPFLIVLGAGVLSAAALLATVMNLLVKQYAAPTYAFFFGLIAASAVVLYRYVDASTPRRVGVAAIGFVLAFVVTGFSATGARTDPPVVLLFVAGTIAISAMVLPGISGSFLLLVMGLYEFVSGIPRRALEGLLGAVGGDATGLWPVLASLVAFLAGAIVGVFTVAYVVREALRRYREATLLFLVSLMAGALRLPATRIAADIGAPSPGTALVVAVPASVGVGAVFLLDSYTDDLEY